MSVHLLYVVKFVTRSSFIASLLRCESASRTQNNRSYAQKCRKLRLPALRAGEFAAAPIRVTP